MKNISIGIVIVGILFAIGMFQAKAYGAIPEQGKQWVRNHPYQIFAWECSPSLNWTQYKGCGLNSLLAYHMPPINEAYSNGVTKFINNRWGADVSELFTYVMNSVTTPDEENGWYLLDEPTEEQIPEVGRLADYVRQNRPNGVTLINICVKTESYMNDVIDTVKPDLLMGDCYPYIATGNLELPNYFDYISAWRSKALEKGIPYYGWVQSFEADLSPWGGIIYRAPSESEMAMNVFSHATLGYKGIGYHLYDIVRPNDVPDCITNALIHEDGTPDAMYTHAQSINSELRNIGDYLCHLTSTDFRFVPGQGHATPQGLTNWSYGAGGDTHITNITVNTSGAKADGLIGFFTDDNGNRYFMLTNLNRGPSLNRASSTANFSIYFDSSIHTIWRVKRDTGAVERINCYGNKCILNLPGGTGDLLCYSQFPLGLISGKVRINNNAPCTNSTSTTLSISAADRAGNPPDFMRFAATKEGIASADWETYSTSRTWTLSSGDGRKTVYVQFRKQQQDGLWKFSSIYCDDIFLDTTAPIGSITIEHGQARTGSNPALLTLSASDVNGLSSMRFSRDNVIWSSWEPYSNTRYWNLASGTGVKTVYVQFKDTLGNVSQPVSDSIIKVVDPGDRVRLNILWRVLRQNGMDRMTTNNAAERDAAENTLEEQVYYVPKDPNVPGTTPLYRMLNSWDHKDSTIAGEGGYTTELELGRVWTNPSTGMMPVYRALKPSDGDYALVHSEDNSIPTDYTWSQLSNAFAYNCLGNKDVDLTSLSAGGVTIASNKLAGGALWEWHWNGKQFLNDYNYTRSSQTCMAWEDRTLLEAGDMYSEASRSPRLRHGAPCYELFNAGSKQVSRSIPFEWDPGIVGGGQDNPVAWSGCRTGKDITLNWLNMGPVARYDAHIYVPDSIPNATLYIPRGTCRGEFNRMFVFDSVTTYIEEKLPDYGSTIYYTPGSGYGGIIMANADATHAFGVFGICKAQQGSVDGFSLGNFVTGGTGQYDVGCVGWSAYRTGSVPAGTNTQTVWLLSGTLDQVKQNMRYLVPPLGNISGNIKLEDFTYNAGPVTVQVELRNHGGNTTTRSINIGSDGAFTLTGISPGTYDISFKASHWLRKTVKDITLSSQ